jgi:hypothetical protein
MLICLTTEILLQYGPALLGFWLAWYLEKRAKKLIGHDAD